MSCLPGFLLPLFIYCSIHTGYLRKTRECKSRAHGVTLHVPSHSHRTRNFVPLHTLPSGDTPSSITSHITSAHLLHSFVPRPPKPGNFVDSSNADPDHGTITTRPSITSPPSSLHTSIHDPHFIYTSLKAKRARYHFPRGLPRPANIHPCCCSSINLHRRRARPSDHRHV
jgi:hypothetical protein